MPIALALAGHARGVVPFANPPELTSRGGVQPGDVVRLAIQNGGSLATNVHYHGLQVSPLGAGDHVFLEIDPTATFRYEMPIPSDHAQGLFWYSSI